MSDRVDLDVPESGSFDHRAFFGARQLLVVSNRQPYRHEIEDGDVAVDRPIGGLTASLDPMMQGTGGTWIAWGDGDADEGAVDGDDSVGVPPEDPSYALRRVWLSDEQVEGYYYGFSNQVLWPLCHSSLSTVHAEESHWRQYRRTNEQFAAAVIEEAGERPVIWLQDYHLALAPWFVRRELGSDPLLMQFWHIPWPSWDVYRACPHQDELVRGLLGNDVLGFHVHRYATNFLECVDGLLDDASINWRSKEVSYRGSLTSVEAIPMGVPAGKIRHKAATYQGHEFTQFKQSHDIDPETRIAVGVDRLDYSKGIPERLRALERLWERHPEWRGTLTCVQKGTESRSKISAYRSLQEEVDDEVDRINERFGTDDWQPIVRVSEYLSQRELYGLYRHADLVIVSPIRDGLNLVASEFAAAQVDLDGVLVLSTQTGIHDLLGEYAVSVSPYDVGGFASRLDDALRMSPGERRSRMEQLRRTVAVNDLQAWLRKNADAARAVGRPQSPTVQGTGPRR